MTEPDAGLDTTRLKTRAMRDGNDYVIKAARSGSRPPQVTEKMLILARTTPVEEAPRAVRA